MGELIKKIGSIKLADKVFDVELNEAPNEMAEQIIHIQNKKVRYECSKGEFLTIAATMLSARDNLMSYKKRGE